MYTYLRAIGLARSIGAQWKEVDLSEILVYDIYNTYSKVYLTLSTVYADIPFYVDMDSLREEFSAYGNTLKQLLTDLGNRALETVSSLPNTDVKYVKYSDAFFSGYKVDTTIIGVGSPENYRPNERLDLKITRPDFPTDMRLLHTHCLLSVNGYYHFTDANETAAYIYQGKKSLDLSNNNHVGITSFLEVGALTKVKIKDTDITTQTSDSTLYERTYIHLDQDLTNKSVLLVIGGYLYLPQDGVFWQSGEKTFAINWSAIPLLDRYYESKRYLDLTGLGLSVSSVDPEIVNAVEFMSDAVLKKYLTLSQSFFVIVDTTNLFSNQLFLRNCNLPGMFTAYQEPVYPLVVGYGKLAEYWKVYEDQQWSVTVQDSFMSNFVFDQKPMRELQNVTPTALPFNSFEHSKGFMLQIGTYK